MKEVNDRVIKRKERGNTSYKLISYGKTWLNSFVEGDLVYRNMRKEIFPQWTYDKLKLKNIVLCRILKKILDNSYVVEFPDSLRIFPIFNASEISKFEEGSMSDGKEIVKLLKKIPVQSRDELTEVLNEHEFNMNRSQNKK